MIVNEISLVIQNIISIFFQLFLYLFSSFPKRARESKVSRLFHSVLYSCWNRHAIPSLYYFQLSLTCHTFGLTARSLWFVQRAKTWRRKRKSLVTAGNTWLVFLSLLSGSLITSQQLQHKRMLGQV